MLASKSEQWHSIAHVLVRAWARFRVITQKNRALRARASHQTFCARQPPLRSLARPRCARALELRSAVASSLEQGATICHADGSNLADTYSEFHLS